MKIVPVSGSIHIPKVQQLLNYFAISEERLLRPTNHRNTPISKNSNTPVVAYSSHVNLDTPKHFLNTTITSTAPSPHAPLPAILLHGHGAGLGFFFRTTWALLRSMGRSSCVPFTVQAKKDGIPGRVREAFFIEGKDTRGRTEEDTGIASHRNRSMPPPPSSESGSPTKSEEEEEDASVEKTWPPGIRREDDVVVGEKWGGLSRLSKNAVGKTKKVHMSIDILPSIEERERIVMLVASLPLRLLERDDGDHGDQRHKLESEPTYPLGDAEPTIEGDAVYVETVKFHSVDVAYSTVTVDLNAPSGREEAYPKGPPTSHPSRQQYRSEPPASAPVATAVTAAPVAA
ncbi:hypothetical protein JOM56_015467 [Amanita muscaria]